MAKPNICYHNVRINLDNEQHCRVHRVLSKLNKKIHKSVNQFIVDAVDFYINLDLCQYFRQKKSKGYAAFLSSSSSFCWGVI